MRIEGPIPDLARIVSASFASRRLRPRFPALRGPDPKHSGRNGALVIPRM
jgi:hypothetical protein